MWTYGHRPWRYAFVQKVHEIRIVSHGTRAIIARPGWPIHRLAAWWLSRIRATSCGLTDAGRGVIEVKHFGSYGT